MPGATVHIAASADRVWGLVSDVTQMGRWSPETTSARWRDSLGPAVGVRFTGRNRRRLGWSTTCTVTACEPGRRFAFVVGKGATAWEYALRDAGDGCEVTESFQVLTVPGAVGRILTRLAVGVRWSQREADLLRGVEQTLLRLKAHAEALGTGEESPSRTLGA